MRRQKECGPIVLARLVVAFHSGTLSHYCLPRELLAAGFHPWPVASLLSQPEYLGLLHGTHIDGELSADVPSTWTDPLHSDSQPQTIPQSDLTEAWLQKMPTFQSISVKFSAAMYETFLLLSRHICSLGPDTALYQPLLFFFFTYDVSLPAKQKCMNKFLYGKKFKYFYKTLDNEIYFSFFNKKWLILAYFLW